MHPIWFRIGGVAADLPKGWDGLVRDFLAYMPQAAQGVRHHHHGQPHRQGADKRRRRLYLDEAVEWGWTGPNLRACGLEWDFRKKRPYSGYERFEFDIPRQPRRLLRPGAVRVEEMRQSLRIIEQCLEQHAGRAVQVGRDPGYAAAEGADHARHRDAHHPFPRRKLGAGRSAGRGGRRAVEAAKGNNTYYLVSDGEPSPTGRASGRRRLRICRLYRSSAGALMMPDLIAILGSMDYVMGDCDR